MPIPSNTALLYVVFVAPGFVAVMTAISLAAVEDDYSPFVLLVSSLVASLVIDTGFLAVYQWLFARIYSFDQLAGILFNPYLRVDFVAVILLFSVVVGAVAAVSILLNVPSRMREVLQAKSRIQVNPRQPWANFVRDTAWLRIKTSDDELYMGAVSEWSRAGRPKEVQIDRPHRLNAATGEYEEMAGESVLFLEDDIDRVVMISKDEQPSYFELIWSRWRNRRTTQERAAGWIRRRTFDHRNWEW